MIFQNMSANPQMQECSLKTFFHPACPTTKVFGRVFAQNLLTRKLKIWKLHFPNHFLIIGASRTRIGVLRNHALPT